MGGGRLAGKFLGEAKKGKDIECHLRVNLPCFNLNNV